MGSLRIAVLSSIAHRTPPRDYGPWEQVASTLADGLAARGHDVTLFATADSRTGGRLRAVAPAGYEDAASYDVKAYECLHVAGVFERAGEFDVISNQFDFLPLSYSRLVATPVVTTIHGFSSERIVPVYAAYDDIATYVSISDADRHPTLTYASTIHHGLRLADFTYRAVDGDYLLFLGRLHPDKGAHHAIDVAERTGLPLLIAGIVQDRDYFDDRIVPRLTDRIRYLGPVGTAQRDTLLGGALALLHLIEFPEPFGLAVIEAMATGTPVIAFALGSLPELVIDGRTGRLVEDVDAACGAVTTVTGMRPACRAHVEAHFTDDRMVDEYEALFASVVSGDQPPTSSATSPRRSTKPNRTDESLAP